MNDDTYKLVTMLLLREISSALYAQGDGKQGLIRLAQMDIATVKRELLPQLTASMQSDAYAVDIIDIILNDLYVDLGSSLEKCLKRARAALQLHRDLEDTDEGKTTT